MSNITDNIHKLNNLPFKKRASNKPRSLCMRVSIKIRINKKQANSFKISNASTPDITYSFHKRRQCLN